MRNVFDFQLRELARLKLFGKPGHGAPTGNVRKKKFTEYQLTERPHPAEPADGGGGANNNYTDPNHEMSRSYHVGNGYGIGMNGSNNNNGIYGSESNIPVGNIEGNTFFSTFFGQGTLFCGINRG